MLCSLAAVELIGTDFPADVAVSTVISAGHAFVQNLRRGHYELAPEVNSRHRLAAAFAELALAI